MVAGCWCARKAHSVVGRRAPLWLLLVADDLNQSCSGRNTDPALLVFLLLAGILQFPISWNKINGGQVLRWVGYEILLASSSVGITESRAAWASKWCLKLLTSDTVLISELEEGLGRLTFVAGVLEWDRAFLSPFYCFVAVQADRSHRKALPPYVRLALAYLSESLPLRHHSPCGLQSSSQHTAIRVDAHASPTGVGIGGWLPFIGSEGMIDVSRSPWFSVDISPAVAPWVFEREGKSFRTIASLEALAVLVAVKCLLPASTTTSSSSSVSLTQVLTDNRGNGHILSKLGTTKFPLSAVVMELAFELKKREIIADVAWIPRESNVEADALSNGDFSQFNEELRVKVDLPKLQWHFLDRALAMGQLSSNLRSGRCSTLHEYRLGRKQGTSACGLPTHGDFLLRFQDLHRGYIVEFFCFLPKVTGGLGIPAPRPIMRTDGLAYPASRWHQVHGVTVWDLPAFTESFRPRYSWSTICGQCPSQSCQRSQH